MAYQTINLGTVPNDGKGDPLRVAFTKINNNFASVANLTANSGINGSLQFITISNIGNTQIKTFTGSENLVFNVDTNSLNIGSTILPITSEINSNSVDIGSTAAPFDNIYGNTLNIGNATLGNINGLLSISGTDVTFDSAIIYGNLAQVKKQIIQTVTYSSDPNQVIYQLPLNEFTSITAEIESIVTNDQDKQKVTLGIIKKNNNSNNISYTAYNTMFLGNIVTTYDVVALSGNVSVLVSPKLLSGSVVHNISLTINS